MIKKPGGAIFLALVISLVLAIFLMAANVLAAWFGQLDILILVPFIGVGVSALGVYFFCALLITKENFFEKLNIAKSASIAILIVVSVGFLSSQIYTLGNVTKLFQSDCRSVVDFSTAFFCGFRATLAIALLNIGLWLPSAIVIEFFRLVKFWRSRN
jgi:hypothetical protein